MVEEVYDVEEFWKFKMKVGSVKEAEKVPRTKKLLKLKVDFGDEKRTVIAGIGDQYEEKDLLGKNMIFVTNLTRKKIAGIESEAMLIVGEEDNGKVHLITVDMPIGTRVW